MGLSSLPVRSPFVPLSLFERQLVQSPFVSPPAVTGGSARQRELTSLRSSIVDYRYENGRRYHAYRAGSYWGPNDEKAQDHLDFGEFADLHPSSAVIGTDLSPIQPRWVPPNVQFEVDDCCDEWLYGDDAFDFVHIRGLYGCIADWDAFYKQALRSVKPGGWIEQVEQSVVPKSDDGTTVGTIFEEWGRVSLEAGEAFGKSLRIVDESRDRMIKAGFVDVAERRYKIPIGGWASDPRLKQLGLYNRLLWEEGIEGWSMYLLTTVLKWSREEVELYLSRMRKGLRTPRIHAYQECTVVYGRKPAKADLGAQ
ncbi:S-adenosyl-L-methionine-dependent methyltransferase [Aspergillus foveolatus]|uniref:S-adenosyl-L-methionine-dependent methyltransferase n=1 Tax=Aspergillus foveolatus TaxID=210207 RepID=UPI003CCE129C